MNEGRREGYFRIWLLPFSVLLGVSLLVFVATFVVDLSGSSVDGWELVANPDPSAMLGALSNAAEVVAAVLGIAITVVAIIVELASNRYTHRITELFVSEPINFGVMGFFVVTALQCLAVSILFDQRGAADDPWVFVPMFGATVSMVMLGLSLVILLPYFAFVFSFLNPIEIVERIRRHTVDVIASKSAAWTVVRKQEEAVRGIEQLADVALNAMEHKDKGVSMASADALKELLIDYQKVRPSLREDWYAVEGELAVNPDFVSMSPDVLESVSERRIWFEMKILRQYQTLYNEALNRMRDMNYLIAINTRRIAQSALEEGNLQLFETAVKFFNTYLRATINAKDVRTAYNVLNQYRNLAESILPIDGGRHAVEIAKYFKYYGGVSFNVKLPFILETAAYDLCTLNEIAYEKDSPSARELLRIFLQVDRESESEVQEVSLRGVRKAQVKLATFYLLKDDEELAREVFRDMSHEPPKRLASIRNELLAIKSSEFWEISDRGVNFDYLPPRRKRRMLEFFGWFGNRLPPVPDRISSDLVTDTIVPASSSAGTDRAPDSDAMPSGIAVGGEDPAEPARPDS